MKNGNVIKAKVLEVGLEEVKYELYTKEGGGAVYTVPKNKIEVIEFENGYREEFLDDNNEVADLKRRHQVGFNYIDLLFLNFSADYEYYLNEKNDFSVFVPLRFGIPIGASIHSRNIFETGAGIFVYPYRKKKFNYHTGIEFMYRLSENEFGYYDPNTNTYYSNGIQRLNYMGVYVTNGIKLNFKERFGLGYSFSFGVASNLETGYIDPIGKMNFNFFYRF